MDALELESLLAAIGPEEVMRGRPTLHKYQLQRAADLPRDLRRRMLRYFATDSFGIPGDLPAFDLEDVRKLVTAEQTPDEAMALAAAVPTGNLLTEIGIEANRIRSWGAMAVPKEVPVAGRMEEPDASDVSNFRRSWEVATDPMVVMRDLAAGCLADDQVAVVSLLYPALYGEMRQAATDARALTAGRRGKKWEPSPKKQAQLNVLLQADTTDVGLASAVQQVYAAEAQREQQAVPQSPPKRSGGGSTEGLTPGERAAAGA